MVDDDPAEASDPDAETDRLQLSIAQVAASSLAAVSAAVVCSYFGVAGTIIGTALASVFATVGSALYAHSLRRTRARLRRLHQAGAASPPMTEVIKTTRRQGRRVLAAVQWRVVLQGAATVFVFSIGVVTAFELTVGKSVSAELGVSHSGSRSTSLGSALSQGKKRAPKAHPTPTPRPSSTDTSSVSPSPSPSPTTTPNSTASATPSRGPDTPTPTSTPTPSASVTTGSPAPTGPSPSS